MAEWMGWGLTGLGALALVLAVLVPAERAALLRNAPLALVPGLVLLWMTGALDHSPQSTATAARTAPRDAPAADAEAPRPERAPLRFLEPLPDLPPRLVELVPHRQREPLQALHAACAAWQAAPTMEAQLRMEEDLTAQVRAMRPQGLWLGAIEERQVGRDSAGLRVRIAPGVTLATAGGGWLSPDSHDTRVSVGTPDYAILARRRVGDPLLFRVALFLPLFGGGECHFLARLHDFMEVGAHR